MSILIFVIDKKGKPVEKLQATYENGQFKAKRNKFLGMFGGEEVTAPFNFEYEIQNPAGRNYYLYRWDGKSLTQLKVSDLEELSVYADYDLQYRLGRSVEESMLHKPPDPKDKLTWLIIAILVILSIVAIFEVNQLNTVAKNLIKPLNASIAQNTRLETYLMNQSRYLGKLDNATINFVENETKLPSVSR